MKDNFQRSLLKGTLEIPFENIASLDENTFNQIPTIDKFLISDTLLSYSIQAPQFPFEIIASRDEKFPYTPFQAVRLISGLTQNMLPVVSYYLTQIHIKYKRLFHPTVIVQVLENRNVWLDHITLLPKVMRERARWLSPLRTSWQWWNSIFKKEIWDDLADPLRFFYFRIMRVFKPGEADILLTGSWYRESSDSKRLLLQIVMETYRHEDMIVLQELYKQEGSKIKATIRQLMFMSEQNTYREILSDMVRKSNGSIDELIKINYGKIKELDHLFEDKKDLGLPPELLFTLPYGAFHSRIKNKSVSLGEYLMSLKNNNNLINELAINYLYKKDIASLSSLLDIALCNDEIKLNTSFLQIFSQQVSAYTNELLLFMMTNCNSVARWHLYRQLIFFGEVSLNKKNSSSLITLTGLYTKGVELNKSVMEDFMARGCFCIDTAYMDDWKLMCIDIAEKSKELKAMKVSTMIEECLTFRKQLETSFEHGK